VKFSIFLPSGFGQEFARIPDPVAAYERIVEIAQLADEAGYETLVAPDHLTTIPPSHEIVFEAWSLITGLARETSRVRIGQLVTGNSYRNPALQAKMASTVDVMSHGRLTFGIGAGWWEPDYTGYGYQFGTAADRLRHLGEAVQIILALWTEKEATFEGRHYQVRGAVNEPKGVQTPHIPLMIAGGGEKVTLRLVARYGDACNIMGSPELAEHKYAVLRRHCDEAGRDYGAITRTATTVVIIRDTDEEARALVPPGSEFAYPGDLGSYGLIGTVGTVRQRLAAFEAAGVQELIVGFQDPTSLDQVAQFADLFVSLGSCLCMPWSRSRCLPWKPSIWPSPRRCSATAARPGGTASRCARPRRGWCRRRPVTPCRPSTGWRLWLPPTPWWFRATCLWMIRAGRCARRSARRPRGAPASSRSAPERSPSPRPACSITAGRPRTGGSPMNSRPGTPR
jgi:F420-dependent oxidoreductase-like protein